MFLAATGSLAEVILGAAPARAQGLCLPRTATGYGPLLPDPAGVIELPHGFRYRVLSREGDALTDGGAVPSSHDGMAAFSAGDVGTWLVRNHEINPEDVAEDGALAVPATGDHTYDPAGVGGTTTLLVSKGRELVRHHVSLAGTVDNCAGGPSPWRTWLSCEETVEVLERPHGYVFEVDPRRGGNPQPIVAMGRFAHEAVSFDRRGRAYLTEDATRPFGCVYRFSPTHPLGGPGSLHAGGRLEAMAVRGVDTDLSIVTEPGSVLPVRWLPVPNANPLGGAASVREQAIGLGATPIKKAEGTWLGVDGEIWFVSSYAGGPLAAQSDDVTAVAHAGQIWRYSPRRETIELVVTFPIGSDFDGPDNITASPHGFAVACTDGENAQYLVGINDAGEAFPFGLNVLSGSEFAGATFSPDGSTLFVNIQGPPGMTLAIWGPWA